MTLNLGGAVPDSLDSRIASESLDREFIAVRIVLWQKDKVFAFEAIVLDSMPGHLLGSGGIDARRLAGDQADRNNKNGWNQAGTNYGAISCLR